MSNSYYRISRSASDDVRWERVEHIKLILTSKAYHVPPEKVAARLIEHMLSLDRANHRRSRGRTNDSSATGVATSATSQHDSGESEVNVRKRTRNKTITGKAIPIGNPEVTSPESAQ